MAYGYSPMTHTPEGYIRNSGRRAYQAPNPLRDTAWGDLVRKAQLGDKSALAEIKRRTGDTD